MDPETPIKNERKKRAAIYKNRGLQNRNAIYAVYLILLLIVIKHFLKQYPIVESAISIIIIVMLLAIFCLVIKNELIKKR